MKKTLVVMIASVFISIVSFSAFSSNYSFLNNSAAQAFTSKDWELFMRAKTTALTKYPDGSKYTWNNPATEHWGFFSPSDTTHHRGITCRNLKIFSSAKQKTGEATFKYCELNNKWKVA